LRSSWYLLIINAFKSTACRAFFYCENKK